MGKTIIEKVIENHNGKMVKPGDIVITNKNFSCGSSRQKVKATPFSEIQMNIYQRGGLLECKI